MNKQQLANKIWESANRMRSKIEANEYKDYILGFIFYKFLSDKEVEFLKKDGYEDDDIKENAHENNESLVDYCQQHLGYFIAYDNLFSTWLAKGSSFTVDNVRTALSAFNRLISETQKKVFSKIFNTLETGLSKLGDSTSSQTKSISELIQLIKDRLYRAEIRGVDAPDGVVLISKDRLSKRSAIKWIPIDKYVWIAKEIKNDVG